jgi:hypothetical protein
MGKLLIFLGIILTVIGLMVHWKVSIPFLGKLPGDIVYKGDHFQVYIPLATGLLISLILSLLLYIFSKLG